MKRSLSLIDMAAAVVCLCLLGGYANAGTTYYSYYTTATIVGLSQSSAYQAVPAVVTVNATVTASPGTSVGGLTVAFYLDSNRIATVTTDQDGHASTTYQVGGLGTGSHVFSATTPAEYRYKWSVPVYCWDAYMGQYICDYNYYWDTLLSRPC